MQYRVGLEQDSFTVCAAFCYMMPPFVIVAMVKMHYSLNTAKTFSYALSTTKGFTNEDIRLLLVRYLKQECDKEGGFYLDADLEDFIRFAQSCKILGEETVVDEEREERAGKTLRFV